MTFKQWLKQVFIGLDQFINTLAFGYADETISSRCYRKYILQGDKKWRWKILYHVVNGLFFDKNHCKEAYESEIERKQYPAFYRQKSQ
ncbi:DNA helicase UvrD [Pasteurellaceae bacterium Macca]|nr:DNA helicase UvrD [Pasteurellaceae bacterium Macca]